MKPSYLILAAVSLGLITVVVAQHCGTAPAPGATAGCCAKQTPKAAAGHCDHAAAAPAGASKELKPLPATLAPVFKQYAEIQRSLASDSTKGVPEAATELAKAIRAAGSGCLSASAGAAEKLARSTDLNDVRKEFAVISDALVQYLTLGGYLPGELREAYCPMAKASWLQKEGELENPYMGKSMLHCGRFKS